MLSISSAIAAGSIAGASRAEAGSTAFPVAAISSISPAEAAPDVGPIAGGVRTTRGVPTPCERMRSRLDAHGFALLGDELLSLRHGPSRREAAGAWLAAASGPDPAAALPAADRLGAWLGHVECALRAPALPVETLRDALGAIVERMRSDAPRSARAALLDVDVPYLAGKIDRAHRPPLEDFMSVLESLALQGAMLSDIEAAVGRAKRRASGETEQGPER